jgi:C4-dicarboxylate-binding protein DctP
MLKSLLLLVAATAALALPARAQPIQLRIGSGHPAGATVYVTELQQFFVPEVVRRARQRGLEVSFTEAYGGSVAKVNETLQAVESGLLDIGGYCMCF